ncbi:MAG: UvrB/UvrC motif-containing protein, partial [bacterium]
HMSQIINKQQVTLNLCEDCANRRGFENPLKNVPFPLGEFLSSMVSESLISVSKELEHAVCPTCQLSYEKFTKTGRLGCGECYNTFRQPLADLLRKIHGSNLHRGKRHNGGGEMMEPLKEEARLRDELKRAIANEEYERAAQIRDMIKEVKENAESSHV